MYKHFLKRFFDFLISLIVLICISPLLLIVSVWLHFANKGAGTPSSDPFPKGKGNWLKRWLQPVIFTQERPGKDAKIFKVIKFKTMTDERDEEGNLLPDAQRLTKVGKFVRSTSLDELPQLINVLKGDMALIGPRPLLVRYLPYYTEKENHRHDVRPGITGWAQVHGRKSITWTNKLKYDVEYVDKLSFWLDIRIIWKTIIKVIMREDVGVETSGTNDFNDFREHEWALGNRQDLIDKTRAKVKTLS